MLTIFTTPKPFCGHIGVIQRNALESWTRLRVGENVGPRLSPASVGFRMDGGLKPAPTRSTAGASIEVIVFGDEEGAAQVCRDLGLRHEPAVERSPSGTKYLHSIFGRAQEIARHDVLAYVNCDIVLTADFARSVERVTATFSLQRETHETRNSKIENRSEQNLNAEDAEAQRTQRRQEGVILRFAQDDNEQRRVGKAGAAGKFLMVGRRWDANIAAPLDFSAPDWAERARATALETNRQQSEEWIDYFVFPRGMYIEIPPLVIGRVAWDRWLIRKARLMEAPVVDATRAVLAIHQNHDYGYHPQGKQGVWQDAEALRNYELAGGIRELYTIDDATHRLTPTGIARNPGHVIAPARRALRRWRVGAWHAILSATRPIRHPLGIRRRKPSS